MENMSYYIIGEILRSELYERCEKKRCIFGGGTVYGGINDDKGHVTVK